MKTIDALRLSYHEGAEQLHFAIINGKVEDAQLWVGTLRQIADQLHVFGERPNPGDPKAAPNG